jgi:hypothetical protein
VLTAAKIISNVYTLAAGVNSAINAVITIRRRAKQAAKCSITRLSAIAPQAIKAQAIVSGVSNNIICFIAIVYSAVNAIISAWRSSSLAIKRDITNFCAITV